MEHDEAWQQGPAIEIEGARPFRNRNLGRIADRANPATLDDQRLVLPGGAPVPSTILTFLSATRGSSRRRGIASFPALGVCATCAKAVTAVDKIAKSTVAAARACPPANAGDDVNLGTTHAWFFDLA